MQKRVIASLDYNYSAGKLMAFIFGGLGLIGIVILVIIASQKVILKIAETHEKLGNSEKAKEFSEKLK